MEEQVKLHLGCGWRNFGDKWIHIDGGDYDHLDIKTTDLSTIPFDNNSVDLIYASHLIAYFDREEIGAILTEWHRILKVGGILRLATPDATELFRLYSCGIIKLGNILGPLYGKMPLAIDSIYHKTVYDYNSLSELTSKFGFTGFRRYDWRKTEHSMFDDHSQAYLPHMDKENGTLISLNVECFKC